MMEALGTKLKEKAMDSTEYVANRSACFLCTNGLHNGEGVRLKHDPKDIHLMGQNDAIFQGNDFECVKGVICREGLT